MKRTPLYEYHRKNAKMVEFAGFEMPIWYTGIIDEHLAVRNHCGVFDVSHMGRFEIVGPEAEHLVNALVPAQISEQPEGKSIYALLLNERCGIIDDLIVNKRTRSDYLLVVNAANAEGDLSHIGRLSDGLDVEVNDITAQSAMIAVQGPESLSALQPVCPVELTTIGRFRNARAEIEGKKTLISRTGYTGEDGFEIIIQDSAADDNSAAVMTWERLAKGTAPCGLGARDSLRLEAGLPLHGSDIGPETDPSEADILWTVSKGRTGYVGEAEMRERLARPPSRIRVGLVLDEKIPRRGFRVESAEGEAVGSVTSGTYSPILRRGIAMAYVPIQHSKPGQRLKVLVRDDPVDATVVKPPFYDADRYGWKRRHTNG